MVKLHAVELSCALLSPL